MIETIWYISILTNSAAISLAALLGILYAQWRLKTLRKKHQSVHTTLKWYDYIAFFILTGLGALIAYSITYTLFGYVPMSKLKQGLIHVDALNK